jgi:hypothetical protein
MCLFRLADVDGLVSFRFLFGLFLVNVEKSVSVLQQLASFGYEFSMGGVISVKQIHSHIPTKNLRLHDLFAIICGRH